jgi:hypothetical protein
VIFPPRARQAFDKSGTDGIEHLRENDRYRAGRLQQGPRGCAANSQDDVGRECNQFRCVSANALGVAPAPTEVNASIAAVDPARLRERLRERFALASVGNVAKSHHSAQYRQPRHDSEMAKLLFQAPYQRVAKRSEMQWLRPELCVLAT